MRSSILIVTCSLAILVPVEPAKSSTLPAGTALNVKTLGAISTKDAVGKKFSVELEGDIRANGKVVARAGTKLVGKVITSTKIGHSPLTLDLTGISSNGQIIPIKTTGPIEPQSVTRGRNRQVKTRDFILPPGSKMQFHLAQPVAI